MRARLLALPLGAALLLGAASAAAPAGDRCAALAGVTLANGRVVSSRLADASETFDSGMSFTSFAKLPMPGALCRVELDLTPAPGSDVRADLWLPIASRWNGKLLEAGNGGLGGSLSDPMVTMRHAVLRGFAAVGNDMGHRADDTGWLLRDAAMTDYGWRADRATSLAARTLVAAYYGKPARLKYFEGCSTGGREALMAATRFPGDYDGVVAGAPAAAYADIVASGTWMQQQLLRPGVRPDPADLKLVGDAVLAQCDALDGLKDGLIADPRSCRFDPMTLVCRGGAEKGTCLSAPKAELFAQFYAGPRSASGAAILPGLPVGGEAIPDGWLHWIVSPVARHAFFAKAAVGGMALRDPSWKIADFSIERDLPRLRKAFAELESAAPTLEPFRRNGGKAIVYHGWADAGINPLMTLDWRNRVVRTMGQRRADDVLALFMVPGLSHCAGGPGPDSFDMLDALDAWRDRRVSPGSIDSRWHAGPAYAAALDMPAGPVTAARPICRYPRIARWDGRGSAAAASSFSCR